MSLMSLKHGVLVVPGPVCRDTNSLLLLSSSLGPGRPSAGGPRWDCRLNTVTPASPHACGAPLCPKQGKQQNLLNLPTFSHSSLLTFQPSNLFQKCLETAEMPKSFEYGKQNKKIRKLF